MSLTYKTICDICGNMVEGWPQGGGSHPGWMQIHSDQLIHRDICDECKPHVERALESLKAERQT